MKKHIKFSSIEQFRHVVKSINYMASFQGLDEDGEPIINKSAVKPILKATGTVKLHGTNAGVSYNSISGMWVQSRKQIITMEHDNAGFAFFIENNKGAFKELFYEIEEDLDLDLKQNTITIFGEWCGKGIQSGVGINELDKMFVIIGVKISSFVEEESAYWIDYTGWWPEKRIFNISNFEGFEIIIDFNESLLAQNKMIEMMEEVEKECPVAKAFGVSGIGEGIVFKVNYKNSCLLWKVKGNKHSKSKVKKLKKVDNEKLNKIIEVVNKVTPAWRLEQIYNEVFDILNGGIADVKKTGDFIRTMIKDVIKEEYDIINEADLIPKDINSKIAQISKQWLFEQLDKQDGLK